MEGVLRGHRIISPAARMSKRKQPRRLLKKIAVYLVFACSIIFVLTSYYQFHSLKEKEHFCLENLEQINAKEKAVRQKLASLKHDRHFQEELVRKELGWIKKNEILYIFEQSK